MTSSGIEQRRYNLRHEMLTQRTFFVLHVMAKKRYAESAFRDACRTSSGDRGRGEGVGGIFRKGWKGWGKKSGLQQGLVEALIFMHNMDAECVAFSFNAARRLMGFTG